MLAIATGANVSLINVDLPEPETPVIQVINPIGISTSIDFKLLPPHLEYEFAYLD